MELSVAAEPEQDAQITILHMGQHVMSGTDGPEHLYQVQLAESSLISVQGRHAHLLLSA